MISVLNIRLKTNRDKSVKSMTECSYPAYSMMSKKRFQELSDVLKFYIDDDKKVDEAVEKFKHILRFDPSKKQYTPENGKVRRETYHQRAKQLGTTHYETSGIKHAYHSRKAKLHGMQSGIRNDDDSNDSNGIQHVE